MSLSRQNRRDDIDNVFRLKKVTTLSAVQKRLFEVFGFGKYTWLMQSV